MLAWGGSVPRFLRAGSVVRHRGLQRQWVKTVELNLRAGVGREGVKGGTGQGLHTLASAWGVRALGAGEARPPYLSQRGVGRDQRALAKETVRLGLLQGGGAIMLITRVAFAVVCKR